MVGVRSGKGGDHVLDLIVLEHQAELAFAGAAIVANGGDVFRAFPREGLNQIIWEARAAESAEHDSRAIGNIGHDLVETGVEFLLHRAVIAPARMFGRNFDSTPLARSQQPVSVPLKSCATKARKSASSSTSISRRELRRTMTWAWTLSASARCLAKLPLPKCDGNRVGGVRKMAFVPVPSRDGTITRAGGAQSIASNPSISSDCANGTSSGSRSTALMPRSAHCCEAASTE